MSYRPSGAKATSESASDRKSVLTKFYIQRAEHPKKVQKMSSFSALSYVKHIFLWCELDEMIFTFLIILIQGASTTFTFCEESLQAHLKDTFAKKKTFCPRESDTS